MTTLLAIIVIFGIGYYLGNTRAYNQAYDDSYRRLMKLVDKVDKINKENK